MTSKSHSKSRSKSGSKPSSTSSSKPKIGLALGSGGARGFCHIGVIRALEALGIEAEIVAGASMGALVGAAYAGGRLDAFEAWAEKITVANFLGLVDVRFSGGGLVEGREISGLLKRIELPTQIEELERAFVAVATDYRTGREIWFEAGALGDAVRASVAIPGVFSPIHIDGRWLLDGGMSNPVPVSTARAMGADVIIAVNPNAHLEGHGVEVGTSVPASQVQSTFSSGIKALQDRLPSAMKGALDWAGRGDAPSPPGYLQVVSNSIDIMSEAICRARLAGDPPQVLLSADLGDMSILDFHDAKVAIAHGHQMVADQEALIKRVCGV